MTHQSLYIAAGLAFCLTGGCGKDDSGAQASSPLCGNGITEQGEECDQGPANSDSTPGACRSDCTRPTCGDQVTDPWEDCDGEVEGEDCTSLGLGAGSLGCTDRCRYDTNGCEISAACGNGLLDPGEECDKGADNSDAYDAECTTACRIPVCGDGILQAGEQCDHGEMNSDSEPDACRTDCFGPVCGDGVADTGEQCDPGPDGEGDGCTADCRATSFSIVGVGQDPSLATARDGHFLVVGRVGGGVGIIYSNTGLPATEPFPVLSQDDPVVVLSTAMADDGSFVVAGCIAPDLSHRRIALRRYDAGGNALGDEIVLGRYDGLDELCPVFDVGMAADGGFVVFWGTSAQRYDGLGAAVGPEISVGPFSSTSVGLDGNFAVAHVNANRQAVARYYDNGGNLKAEVTSDMSVERMVAVEAGPGDGFRLACASGSSLYLLSYDGLGNEVSRNSIYAHGDVDGLNLSKAQAGGFIISWVAQSGTFMTPTLELYALRLNADGEIVTPVFKVNDDGSIRSTSSRFLATDSSGRSVFVYSSYNGTRCRLYDARALPRGPGAW